MGQKGLRYVPEIDTLLRDAQPLWREIEGADAVERRRNERRRDVARDTLIRLARQAEEAGTPLRLDHGQYYERLKEEAGGTPRQSGGRPEDDHYAVILAVAAGLAVTAAHDNKAGVVGALESVARRAGLSYERVRAAHYRTDPEWRREVALSASMLAECRPGGSVWNLPDVKPEFPETPRTRLKRVRHSGHP